MLVKITSIFKIELSGQAALVAWPLFYLFWAFCLKTTLEVKNIRFLNLYVKGLMIREFYRLCYYGFGQFYLRYRLYYLHKNTAGNFYQY